jgi:hypothetical protein
MPASPRPSSPPEPPARPATPAPSQAPRPAAEGEPRPAARHEPAPGATGNLAAAAAAGASAKDHPPEALAERPGDQDQDTRSRRATSLLRFTSARRPETPEPEAPTTQGGATGTETEFDRLTQSIESVQESLGGQPAEFYERELPQIAASEIAKRVRADVIVLLLDNGQGLMEVSGEVGLSPDERQLTVEYSRDVMRELFRAGIGLIENTNRVRRALIEIPGSQADTLIMVPLVHERLGFGVLMAGRDRNQSGGQFTDADVEALMGFADGIASSLRTVVLLRHLKGQLSALEDQE